MFENFIRLLARYLPELCVLSFLSVFNLVGVHQYFTTGKLPEWFYLSAGNSIGAAIAYRYKKNGNGS